MTGVIATIPRIQFLSALGLPLAGGKLTTYLAGTTTPEATYQDQDLTIKNPTTITLDATGSCLLWLDPAKSYKFLLKNALGIIQPGWPVDDITGASTPVSLTPVLAPYAKTAEIAAPTGSSKMGFYAAGPGAVPRTAEDKLRESVSPEDYFTIGEANWTQAIDKAMATSKRVRFGGKEYERTAPMFPDGHILEGVASEIFGSSAANETRIVFVGVTGDAIINRNTLSEFNGIHFKQKDWSTVCNGLRIERAVIARRCMFTHFNGHGQYAYSVNGVPAPFHSYFDNCLFDYNAKHGAVVGNGANAMSYVNCSGRWNGSPAYDVQPPVGAGLYDGLYVDGAMAEFPAGASIEPQQLLVHGGNWSYNSRYGINLKRCSDSVVIGGYAEVNRGGHDMAIDSVYGTTVLNPMLQQPALITTVQADPTNASRNLTTYPNHIVIRGQHYRSGLMQAGAAFYGFREAMCTAYTWGTGPELRRVPMADGSVEIQSDGPQKWKFGDNVTVSAKKWRLGGAQPADSNNYMSAPAGEAVEGNIITYFVTGSGYGSIEVANGGGANPAGAFLKVPKNSVTGRGISSPGTINANGTDYAEYMRKAFGCGVIAKGQIVGINASGELTDEDGAAVTWVVKSTNPSYVGGDGWANHLGERPRKPAEDSAPDVLAKFEQDSAAFDVALEEARQEVDRIAFAGQVPVNVLGAQPGEYILPDGGGTPWDLQNDPDVPEWFKKYERSVGKVIAIEDDGRARVIVKVV